MALTNLGHTDTEKNPDYVIYTLSKDQSVFYQLTGHHSTSAVCGYYVSVRRGLDVDKPRNLAKIR